MFSLQLDQMVLTNTDHEGTTSAMDSTETVNARNQMNSDVLHKMNALSLGQPGKVKPTFVPHPDTAFMLAGPQFALPVPKPTPEYMTIAEAKGSIRLANTNPILLILDLNGTLLYRPNRQRSHIFDRREHVNEFLKYIFDAFCVMVWTTAQPGNAKLMVNNLLSKGQLRQLVTTWDRRRFNLNAYQYSQKTVVYKRLEWIWADEGIQSRHPDYARGGRWSQANTVLLDDSSVKAVAQPHNHILVPEFSGNTSDASFEGGSVLEQVVEYLEAVKVQSNVSSFMKANPFKVDDTRHFRPSSVQQ